MVKFKRKRLVWVILPIFFLGVITAVVYYYVISLDLTVSTYEMEADVSASLRIVQLSDLHNAEFGGDNADLIDLVAEQDPDLIVMTGDMLNQDDENLDIVCRLISRLTDIAPVYYGYGNHETSWEETYGTDLTSVLTESGAVVVNNDFVDIEINGVELRIGGYMGYYRQPGMFSVSDEQRSLELAFAEEFEDTDRIKILLNHIPTAWVDWEYINKYPVDVVFSGHYHGGVIRIPIIDRGIYAPYVGLFPKYTKGVFPGMEATCIISTGLGSEHSGVPRLNNPPEIVVVDLVPAAK